MVSNNADPEMVDAWGFRQNKVGNSAMEVAKFLGHTDCFYALTSNKQTKNE